MPQVVSFNIPNAPGYKAYNSNEGGDKKIFIEIHSLLQSSISIILKA